MEIVGDIIGKGDCKTMVADKLRKRDEERLLKNDQSRALNDEVGKNKSQIAYFEKEFRLLKSNIVSKLNANSQSLPNDNSAGEHLDDVTKDIQELQNLVAEAQFFLPTYDKRVANETLNTLQESLNAKRNALLPKKKFAFKARKKDVCAKIALKEARDEPDMAVLDQPIQCGFVDKVNEELILMADEVQSRDVNLLNLKDCVVKIYGNPSTVHVSHLTHCTVLLGPVSTSAFVDNCTDTTFHVACQQLRIHSSSDCHFYVHIISRSIIEDCKGLRFAPYDWDYDDIACHFQSAGMDRAVNNWRCIDDFNWLVQDVPSPNWAELVKGKTEK